jgi:aspartate ammonia-lyase
VQLSGILKRTGHQAVEDLQRPALSVIGPARGLWRDQLCRRMQPGSSIMPGKVNPVIPGSGQPGLLRRDRRRRHDHHRAEAGQLQLNAFEPVIAYRLLAQQST